MQQILNESSSEFNFYIINLPGIIHSKWKVSEKSLIILSIVISVILFAFHIVSAVELIKYGNTILKDAKDSNEDHSSLPIFHLILSLFIIIFVYAYFYTINLSIYKYWHHKENINIDIRLLAATSITVNISYLVIYYMPYMLLAFIYNPLQTCTIYSVLGIYILCGYVFVWALLKMLTFICTLVKEDETDGSYASDKTDNVSNFHFRTIWIIFFGIGLFLVVIYFSVLIVYALTLGSFDDFGIIQNLVPPLLIGLITFFVVKPTYIKAKQGFNLDSNGHIAKLLLEEYCKEAIQHEIHHKETSDDDNNSTPTSNTS